jgi:hypothetical protein
MPLALVSHLGLFASDSPALFASTCSGHISKDGPIGSLIACYRAAWDDFRPWMASRTLLQGGDAAGQPRALAADWPLALPFCNHLIFGCHVPWSLALMAGLATTACLSRCQLSIILYITPAIQKQHTSATYQYSFAAKLDQNLSSHLVLPLAGLSRHHLSASQSTSVTISPTVIR